MTLYGFVDDPDKVKACIEYYKKRSSDAEALYKIKEESGTLYIEEIKKLKQLEEAKRNIERTPVTCLYQDDSGTWHITVVCPFCGEEHHHGGGDRAVPSLGLRESDCGNGQYFIIAE